MYSIQANIESKLSQVSRTTVTHCRSLLDIFSFDFAG